MRFISFRFEKVSAEKFKDPEGTLNINSNFNLGDLKKDEELSKDLKDDVFKISFNYVTEYENTAKIEFKGVISLVLDKKTQKEFEKNSILDSLTKKQIIDFLLTRTHVEALHLEEKLNLPFHISAPRVKIGENQVNENSV